MARNGNDVTGWVGWIYFAGLMMVVMGILQAISGLAALMNDKYFLVTEEKLAVFDFTTWGWINLILGIVVLTAGSAVVSGRLWGRVIAVLLAVLSIVANFAFLSAYPIWSLVVITIDVLIIYALTVHGSEVEV